MSVLDELGALTQSIGMNSVSLIGAENLSGFEITLDPTDRAGFISIALRERTDEAQRAAIRAMFEVEEMFADEAVLTYVFVDEIEQGAEARSSSPKYVYA